MRRGFIIVSVTAAAVIGVAGLYVANTQAAVEAKRRQVELARQKVEDELQRKEEHDALLAMSGADFFKAGSHCLDAISHREDGNQSLGWSYLDIDPIQFSDIKSAVLMGLRPTAVGSETTGKSLLSTQANETRQRLHEFDDPPVMRFLVSRRINSILGVKELLVRYDCRIATPDQVWATEGDSFVLN